jgi:Flp pilus assembly protein TadG
MAQLPLIRCFLRLFRDVRGTAVIETAIVAPVLVSMALGGFDVSRLVARQHELQAGAADAEQIILAAASGAATDTTTMQAVLANTLDIPNDDEHIQVSKVYRCGTDANTITTPCGSGSSQSTYVRVVFLDTYTPLWTNFGVGQAIDFRVERLVQVSSEQVA